MSRVAGCLLMLVLGCMELVAADLPARWPGVGERWASAVLGPGLAASVYGPAQLRSEEAATLTVVLAAQGSSSILSGVVQLSCSPETACLTGVPMPSGSYVPAGEWAAEGTDTEPALPPPELWRPLLPLAPEVDWMVRVPALVPSGFQGSVGQLVDRLQTWPASAQPPTAACCPDPSEPGAAQVGDCLRQHRAVVFVLGEDLVGVLQAAPRPGSAPATPLPRGGQMVRLIFSLLPHSTPQNLTLWMCVQAPGQSVVHELSVPLPTLGPTFAPSASILTTPLVLSPTPGTLVSDACAVRGKAYPGALVVAWIQIPATSHTAAPLPFNPVRQLADMEGAFAFSVPVPPQAAPACELHVRIEAPGYRSPEVVCPLQVAPSPPAL